MRSRRTSLSSRHADRIRTRNNVDVRACTRRDRSRGVQGETTRPVSHGCGCGAGIRRCDSTGVVVNIRRPQGRSHGLGRVLPRGLTRERRGQAPTDGPRSAAEILSEPRGAVGAVFRVGRASDGAKGARARFHLVPRAGAGAGRARHEHPDDGGETQEHRRFGRLLTAGADEGVLRAARRARRGGTRRAPDLCAGAQNLASSSGATVPASEGLGDRGHLERPRRLALGVAGHR